MNNPFIRITKKYEHKYGEVEKDILLRVENIKSVHPNLNWKKPKEERDKVDLRNCTVLTMVSGNVFYCNTPVLEIYNKIKLNSLGQ